MSYGGGLPQMRGQPARPGETYEASRYHYEGVHGSATAYQYQGSHASASAYSGQASYWGPAAPPPHHVDHDPHHEPLDWQHHGPHGHPSSPSRRRMGRPALWFAAGCCFMIFIIALFIIFLVWALNPTTTTSMEVEAPTGPPLFDCTTNYANWETAWTVEKRQWCCQTHKRGCSRPLSPVIADLPGEGHIYDCHAGLSDWQTGWSLAKRGYCCQTHGIGCPPQGGGNWKITFDCTQEYATWKTSWSNMKKGWCCETTKRGCPDMPPSTTWPAAPEPIFFDCLLEHAQSWSQHEQAWCCTHRKLGCQKPASPSPSSSSHPSSSSSSSSHSYSSSGSKLFDCDVELSSWERSWTEHKKAWCCVHENKACFGYVYTPPTTAPAPTPAPTHRSFHEMIFGPSPAPSTTHEPHVAVVAAVRTTPAPSLETYDCDMHYTTWEADWSIAKQVWCCAHRGHGCAPSSHAHSPSPNPAPSHQNSAPYDCHSDFDRRELWNPQKQDWCCDHQGLSCSSTYDCRDDGQGQSGWSDDKRRWCCEAHGKGCDSARFDCSSGENDWRTGWSTFKQAWCCAQTGKGCT